MPPSADNVRDREGKTLRKRTDRSSPRAFGSAVAKVIRVSRCLLRKAAHELESVGHVAKAQWMTHCAATV